MGVSRDGRAIAPALLAAALVACSGSVEVQDVKAAPEPPTGGVPWPAPSDPLDRAVAAGLEPETGQATGWKRCGSLTVARTPERMTLLRRVAASARAQGVDCELLSASEAGTKWPIMRTDDLAGAVWLPGDGKANPADITQALAKGARMRGVKVLEHIRVTGLAIAKGWVTGVRTAAGNVTAEVVVIAAGMWSRAHPIRRAPRSPSSDIACRCPGLDFSLAVVEPGPARGMPRTQARRRRRS